LIAVIAPLPLQNPVTFQSWRRPWRKVFSMSFPPINRVVTGHDAQGRGVVASEGLLPSVIELQALPGTVFHEVWSTSGAPARIDNGPDPTLGALTLLPPKRGTRVRFVDIPPESSTLFASAAERAKSGFAELGDPGASTGADGAPHFLMHRTQSVDYGIVIEGEVVLVLDREEVTLRPGSVVVQRGTNHAWANRSEHPCRMLFVLVDGEFDSEVSEVLQPAAPGASVSGHDGKAPDPKREGPPELGRSCLASFQWLASEWCR
jgi:mannose-6-phosphate isomerase-like protein (cupin superfamily)